MRYIVGKNNPIVVEDKIINTIKESMEDDNTVVIKPQIYYRLELDNWLLTKI